jgi:presenilin 1
VRTEQPHQTNEDEENIEEIEEEMVLKYGAAHVIKLFIPVTICLIFVIISLSFITSYQQSGGATL